MSENKFLRFFEENGLLKLVGSLLLIAVCVWMYRFTHNNIYNYLVWIPISYLSIAFILFFSAGIIGTIKDKFKKK